MDSTAVHHLPALVHRIVRQRFKAAGWALLATLLASIVPVPAEAQSPVLIEQARLANPMPNTYGFGASLAVDGNTLAAGAPVTLENGIQRGGVAVFTKAGGTWVLQQTLTRTTGIAFGQDVALSGDTLIASTGHWSGFVTPRPLVFVRNNGTWTQQAELVIAGSQSPNGAEKVAVDGDTALVKTLMGGVYVFTRAGGVWTQRTTLVPERTSSPYYGGIALQGDTALVGVATETVGGNRFQGVAYVFVRSGGAWTLQATLTSSPAQADEFFGASLALDGDTALVQGRGAYEFTRVGTTWVARTPLELITPGPGEPPYVCREVIALSGDTAIIAIGWSLGGGGTAYLYQRTAGRWSRRTPGISDWRGTYRIVGNAVFAGVSGDDVVISTVSQVATPGVPALTGSVAGSVVSLSWTPGAGEPPTSYVIEAGTRAGASDVGQVDTGSTATSLTVNAPQGTFYLRVRAKAGTVLSAPSNEVVLTVGSSCPIPSPPSGLGSSVSGQQVALTWTAASGASTYVLEVGSASGLANLFSGNVGAATTLAAGNVPAGQYFIRTRAVNACGTSGPSNEVVTTVAGCQAPGAPTGFTFTVSGTSVMLSWNSSATATSYVMEVGSAPGSADLFSGNVGGGLTLSASGVAPGRYYLRVRAVSMRHVGGVERSSRAGWPLRPASLPGLTASARQGLGRQDVGPDLEDVRRIAPPWYRGKGAARRIVRLAESWRGTMRRHDSCSSSVLV